MGPRARAVGSGNALRPFPPGARGAPQAPRQGQAVSGRGGVMIEPQHFLWRVQDRVGVITLNRPERKNPLTFDSYAELRELFTQLKGERDIKAVVLTGAGGNFCSGGDVHEIIGPLTKMEMPELLKFTRMTGDVVKAMRHCPQ